MKDIIIIANFCRDFSSNDNGRFMYLCKALSKRNEVEIVTSDFSHSMKRHKEAIKETWPFKITFLHEPGYKRNVSISRFKSHYNWGKEVDKYLSSRKKPDVVYCAVPSLTAAKKTAKYCHKYNIKFIIDIQDLWPEAFKMVFNTPIISDITFMPFEKTANYIYKSADEIFAVSDTYMERALNVNRKCKKGYTVFLGTDLNAFDLNCRIVKPYLSKEQNEIWIGYCGSLSYSYDIKSIIDAISILLDKSQKTIKFIVMGEGVQKAEFEEYAKKKRIDSYFLGKLEYPKMCSTLSQCDIVVNPIKKNSAASIINKHGDYAASGKPVINTQESSEYRNLIDKYKMGFNCRNGDSLDIASKLNVLLCDDDLKKTMGYNARVCAEEKFNREKTYKVIIEKIEE